MARYVVVKISNEDQRSLIYDKEFHLDVTDAQVLADLDPNDLRSLNLWAESRELAQELEEDAARRRANG